MIIHTYDSDIKHEPYKSSFFLGGDTRYIDVTAYGSTRQEANERLKAELLEVIKQCSIAQSELP